MTDFIDARGDGHEVLCAVHPDHGRVIYIDDDAYTVEQAREIGHELIKAADYMSQPMLKLPGGAA